MKHAVLEWIVGRREGEAASEQIADEKSTADALRFRTVDTGDGAGTHPEHVQEGCQRPHGDMHPHRDRLQPP